MKIAVSIVSHGQGGLVQRLLADLSCVCDPQRIAVVLTLNIQEVLPFAPDDFPFPILLLHNDVPRGFSANHNAAFAHTESDFFCVLNPDIRLTTDPFPRLIAALQDSRTGVAAPVVFNASGRLEDSGRELPTPYRILRKAVQGPAKTVGAVVNERPDWVAGMFLFFPASVYKSIGGFDERYFLYYEDVDICCRLRLAGYQIRIEPRVSVVHDARRDSHKKLRYLWWHIASMTRFFLSRAFFSCYRLKKTDLAPGRCKPWE